MTKNIDVNNSKDLIEEVISKKYIKYYEYENFQDIEKINKIDFGIVYRAKWKNSGQNLILKSFNLNIAIIKEIIHEFELHHKFDFNKNIIQFFGITDKDQTDHQLKEYLLIMEHADSGSLQNYLKENFNELTWEDKYKLAYQLVDAVSYLHDEEIVHQDLHSGNILIHQNTIKLSDFGLSKRIKEVSEQEKSNLFEIVPYIDPKWLNCNINLMQSYSLNKKSDVYSIGVILWEISSGQLPFKDESYDAVLIMRIIQGYREKIIPDTPSNYSILYTECWNNEPDNRPTVNQVVAKLKVIIDLNNSSYKESYHQIMQNFEINKEEIGPTIQNIHEVIFEEELGIMVDELINIYFNELNKGKEENERKKCILNYINNCKINLQEIYTWILNNQNDSNSIYLLGYFNYHGIGINVNKSNAYQLYEKAVKLENIVAQLEYANMCIHVFKNYGKAFKLSRKLAAGGNPNAINRLGYCYENGFGTVIRVKRAFELYQKAANLGNSNGINNLGRCYEVGTGIDINKTKAFELYRKAADLGNSYGIYNLGCCYENGIGIKVNVHEAFKFYQKAADLGNSYGLNNLGICYKNGIGINIDMKKAFESFHKSANLGNYFAQYNLAYMYEVSNGINNINQAINWYKKSAEQGYHYAQIKLRELLGE
ncbi:uncharacterized protein OCT59_014767 [Rhizophagus irregularis]|uniref:Kic1p n=2 Tax=Rhizophagus irregularis TaxID=588596 RepID=A0A015J540_RHIIW|nr:kinase-like domain-containing protein [Rhizophagus irregularis DAOM 181602=DAOM 197198]EXX64622.1 Kic1p [Rhizophagus irregularis DAOM 197198w]POG83120.1 kinase-like domain-containing protein [Rhizophagus irregularis DAOM 181602=DAOM 197198]UZO22404.1 hypothetical protein OCT59_014767 [Rhizophagus irregularis]|eukprot:XP_025189986.1 kinase-like domain-containing protein [Rhizophagus irregularis DAOM 181602=DAOM 197198]